ncbi:MAG TPA: hypothetical protein VGJ37_15090 [Pyrinomonadaceae bacterium]|jgi:hypothetical protein
MATLRGRLPALLIVAVFVVLCALPTVKAKPVPQRSDDEFGPVVRAYLGYLRNEQEVVDDRVSRREVSPTYYRHNSNRIKALRQMAIRLARESDNDYLPELEAVSAGELRLIFGPSPPSPIGLKTGEVVRNTFRFLGVVRSGELFYLFARLDPYEQAEMTEKALSSKTGPAKPEKNQR